ncbi:hypothetical protein BHM03_00060548 [Ensete ventricosum]|nr:hypothetical protein BHM03_00060548 [Ensete ventricosum]
MVDQNPLRWNKTRYDRARLSHYGVSRYSGTKPATMKACYGKALNPDTTVYRGSLRKNKTRYDKTRPTIAKDAKAEA